MVARRLAKRQPMGLCGTRFAVHGIGLAIATSPRSASGSLFPDVGTGGRLHIHGIEEMPAGYDAEVAELFRDLRAASGLSEADLAGHLATRIEVVQALEQGALYALPPWPETCRVVATYGTLLNLDVRPLLRRIYAQVEAGIVELAPKPMPEMPFMAPPEDINREIQEQARPSAPSVSEPFPPQPRQAAPPPSRAPQAVPDWRAQLRQPPTPQPQPRPQPQSPPQPRAAAQPQPRAAPQPQSRRASPLQPQPQPRPAPPVQPQPQARAALPPRMAPAEPPKPARKARSSRMALVKWGLVALVVLGAAFGLWMWLAGPSLHGSSASSGSQPGAKPSKGAQPAPPVTDPNDPRSRKADRLPGPT